MTQNQHRKRLRSLTAAALGLMSVAASATSLYWDADGASSTATGGAGIWDAATALWHNGSATGTLQAWPNTTPNNPDAAVLGGTAGTVTIAAGTTIYVNNVNLQTAAGYILTGGDGSSVLAFSGTTPKINGTTNAACTFTNLKIDTGPGLLITQNGGANQFYFNAGAQFIGTGKVTFGTSGYGEAMNLNAAEPAFTGGFDIARSASSYRSSVVSATVADALGRGPVTVGTSGGACILGYTFGAQAVGGAGDGGAAGVTTSGYGTVALSGAWGASKDRFTIAGGTVIRGSSTQLNKLTRVAAFTGYPGAAGPEVILQSGAVIVNTDGTGLTGNVLNLGTSHDLLFGTVGTMNAAGFSLTIGGGTPWAGLGKNSDGDYTNTTLQKGTITLDDAGGTLGEITLRSNGVNYNYGGYNQTTAGPDQMNYLNLGSGVDCPTFQLAAGSNKVNARVLGTNMLGVVALNSTAAGTKFTGALSKFVVGGPEQGMLVLNQANATGGVPIDVETSGKLYVRNVAGMDSATTVKTGGRLYVESVLNGTGALTVQPNGIAVLSTASGLTGVQNGASVAAAVQPGAIVQIVSTVNDAANLGATQPGAILEAQAINGGGQSLGGFAANGQILVHNPEGYNSYSGFISDSGAGGISGTLTIMANSSGAYPHANTDGGPWDIRENFLAGSVVTLGQPSAGYTARGYTQTSPVKFSNAGNAMGTIHIAGAGTNGTPALRATAPGAINGASAASPATIDFLYADGGYLEVQSLGSTYYNPVDVPAGKAGGIATLAYQTAGTITWAGTVTLHQGSTFDAHSSRYGTSEFTNRVYNSIAVQDNTAANLKITLYNAGSTTVDTVTVNDLTIPAAATLKMNGPGRLYLAGAQSNLHGMLEETGGFLTFNAGASMADGTLMWSGGTLTLNTNSVTGTAKLGYNNGAQNAFTTLQNYTGGTIFKSGVVTFTNDNQLGGATAPLIFDGGTLKVNTAGAYPATRAVILNSTGTVDTNGKATTFSNTVSGVGGLTKAGTGDLNLAVANTFSGDTKISGGTVTLGHSLALQNSTLDYNTYGGTLSVGSLGAATFGGLKGAQNLALPSSFSLTVGNNNQSTAYSGALSGTGATLTKSGSGDLTLTGANSYTGGTTVGSGTLGFANGSLGSSGGITFGGTSTLRWESGNTQDISGAGRIQPIGSGVTATFDTGANTVPLAGTLSGLGGIGKVGTGTLVLTGANSYSGGTTLGSGMLGFANGSLGSTGGITFGASSTLRWETGNVQDISGAGRIQPIGSGVTATFDTGTNDVPFAGSLSGQGGMIKAGSGRLTLNAAQSYTGGTTLDAGVLEINSTLAGNVTVNAGTLAGTGSIAGSVAATGGTLAAGSSPGVLDIGGNLNLGQLATFAAEVGGSTPGDGAGHYDQVNVAGNAAVDGALSLTWLSGYVPSSSDVLYILTRGTGTGTFSGLPEGASLTLGIYAAQITYLANWTGTPGGSSATGGNDIAIYNFIVPEPSVLVLGLLAGGLCLRRRRC